MRTLIIILALWLLPSFTMGQYYVIKVEPEGTVLADGQTLQRRDKLNDQMQLQFASQEAYVHVLSPTNGHFVLSAQKGKKNIQGEFIIALKEAIIPSKEFKSAATRSKGLVEFGAFEHAFDFKKYFQGEMVFLDSVTFQVDEDKFPISNGHQFYIEHCLQEDSIILHLPQEKGSFSIFPNIVTDKEGQDIQQEILKSTLIYYDEQANECKKLAHFSIRFLNNEEIKIIKNELDSIREQLTELSEAEFIEKQAYPYLSFYYGKFSLADIKKLLE